MAAEKHLRNEREDRDDWEYRYFALLLSKMQLKSDLYNKYN